MTSLVAVATGALERTPLSHLLVYCLDRSLSGTLVLQDPTDQRHAILFQRGVPVKVRTGTSSVLLGRLLIELSAVAPADVEDALVAASTLQIPLGKALCDEGKLEPARLLEVLRIQYQRKLIQLFSLPPATAFGFYEKNLLESWGGPEPVPIDVLAVLHAGISLGVEPERERAALASLGERPLKLCVGPDYRRFGFSDRGRAVLDLLRARPMPLAQLEGAGVASPAQVRQVIYTLLLSRHLDLGASGKPPLGHETTSPPTSTSEAGRAAVGRLKLRNIQKGGGIVEVNPPRNQTAPIPSVLAELFPQALTPSTPPEALTPELEARRQEILDRARAIEHENFFTMLGVPQDAPPDTVHAAYLDLAKRWHPDRLPAALAPLRDTCSSIFSHLNKAREVLTDAVRRAEYVELMKQGGGTPEEQARVTRLLEAQSEYRKAELLFKKGDLAGAERFASAAVDKDPEQPDYSSLLAWIRANKPAVGPDDLDASIRLLDTALSASPNHQRSLWYRGSLLKRLGKEKLAMVDFRKLLALDPRHVDAAREVRLFEMRGGGKREETGKGLLGGLFGKKE